MGFRVVSGQGRITAAQLSALLSHLLLINTGMVVLDSRYLFSLPLSICCQSQFLLRLLKVWEEGVN